MSGNANNEGPSAASLEEMPEINDQRFRRRPGRGHHANLSVMSSQREPTWDERILAALPSGVDETLLEENLRLTPTERVEKLQRFIDQMRKIRGAGA